MTKCDMCLREFPSRAAVTDAARPSFKFCSRTCAGDPPKKGFWWLR